LAAITAPATAMMAAIKVATACNHTEGPSWEKNWDSELQI
jgi:hypothetical protein